MRPEHVDQLFATDVPRAVQHQIGKQQTDLLAPQRLGQLHASDLDGQPSAELDASAFSYASRGRQRSGNVSTTPGVHLAGLWIPGLHRPTPSAGRERCS